MSVCRGAQYVYCNQRWVFLCPGLGLEIVSSRPSVIHYAYFSHLDQNCEHHNLILLVLLSRLNMKNCFLSSFYLFRRRYRNTQDTDVEEITKTYLKYLFIQHILIGRYEVLIMKTPSHQPWELTWPGVNRIVDIDWNTELSWDLDWEHENNQFILPHDYTRPGLGASINVSLIRSVG